MSDQNIFDTDYVMGDPPAQPQSALSRIFGSGGLLGLHIVVVALLIYTSYHAIHAASLYADSTVGMVVQIFGYLCVEAVALSLYIAYMNQSLRGPLQRNVAIAIWFVLMALAAAAVSVDGQLVRYGIENMSPWAARYLDTILPWAPIIAGIGAAIVHAVSDEMRARQRQIEEQEQSDRDVVNMRHRATIAREQTELRVQANIANTQLASRMYLADLINQQVRSAEVLDVIRQQAMRDLPRLLKNAGINMLEYDIRRDDPKPVIIDNDPAPRWTVGRLLHHWGDMTFDDLSDMINTIGWRTPSAMYDDLAQRGRDDHLNIPAGLSAEQFSRLVTPAFSRPTATPAGGRFRPANGTNGQHHTD